MLDRIEDAIEDIRKGKMVIVVDDEDRENEGDFVVAAAPCYSRGDQFYEHSWTRIDLCPIAGRAL